MLPEIGTVAPLGEEQGLEAAGQGLLAVSASGSGVGNLCSTKGHLNNYNTIQNDQL